MNKFCKRHKIQKDFDTFTQNYLCSKCVEYHVKDLTKWYKEILTQ